MQTRGLVVRERSQADQWGAVVTITPQGLELISAAARQYVSDARDAVIDQLTQTELKTLATITGKVRRRLATLDSAP